MPSSRRTLNRVLAGTTDRNIRFNDLRTLLLALQFEERIRGSHHIFTRHDLHEILNIQPKNDGMAKPYQVRQIREAIVRHGLSGGKQL